MHVCVRRSLQAHGGTEICTGVEKRSFDSRMSKPARKLRAYEGGLLNPPSAIPQVMACG